MFTDAKRLAEGPKVFSESTHCARVSGVRENERVWHMHGGHMATDSAVVDMAAGYKDGLIIRSLTELNEDVPYTTERGLSIVRRSTTPGVALLNGSC